MFGRKLDVLKSIISTPNTELDIVTKYPVKSIMNVNDKTKIFLTHDNISFDLIKHTNMELNIRLLQQPTQIIKSNVAIASAVTAYARIEMMKYKTIPDIKVYYTDTDSIFVDKELPANLVGDDLGQMKDELSGNWIKKAYFFGIKKYAYIDHNDNVKTIFSGLVRDSLTWVEVESLNCGKILHKSIPDQFFKSLKKLEISIKHKTTSVQWKAEKKILDNKYQHFYIYDIKTNFIERKYKNFITKIRYFLGRYKKDD